MQIVLAAFITPGNINDTTMLPVMLAEIRRRGFDLVVSLLDGDKWYGSDHNCELLFWMGMVPNVRQRKGVVSRGKSHRRKAAGMLSDSEYRKRATIEGILGAEETRRHQLHRRFAKGWIIAWNTRALNRFACASRLKTPMPPYGGLAHVECA